MGGPGPLQGDEGGRAGVRPGRGRGAHPLCPRRSQRAAGQPRVCLPEVALYLALPGLLAPASPRPPRLLPWEPRSASSLRSLSWKPGVPRVPRSVGGVQGGACPHPLLQNHERGRSCPSRRGSDFCCGGRGAGVRHSAERCLLESAPERAGRVPESTLRDPALQGDGCVGVWAEPGRSSGPGARPAPSPPGLELHPAGPRGVPPTAPDACGHLGVWACPGPAGWPALPAPGRVAVRRPRVDSHMRPGAPRRLCPRLAGQVEAGEARGQRLVHGGLGPPTPGVVWERARPVRACGGGPSRGSGRKGVAGPGSGAAGAGGRPGQGVGQAGVYSSKPHGPVGTEISTKDPKGETGRGPHPGRTEVSSGSGGCCWCRVS